MRNVEIKAKVRNLAALIQKAKVLSSSNGELIKQHDTFYKSSHGRLKLRKFEDGSAELIYYDRLDTAGPKTSTYEKAPISAQNVDGLHSVLSRALGPGGIVQKTRHLFLVGQTRVHVDLVDGLGDFMELEVVLRAEQSAVEGEGIAKGLMAALGVESDDLLSGAYTDLLSHQQ